MVRTYLVALIALAVGILAVPAFDFLTHRVVPALKGIAIWKTQLLFGLTSFSVSWAVQMMAATQGCAPNCDLPGTLLNAQHALVTAGAMTILGFILKHGQQMTQLRNTIARPRHDPGA